VKIAERILPAHDGQITTSHYNFIISSSTTKAALKTGKRKKKIKKLFGRWLDSLVSFEGALLLWKNKKRNSGRA
jgi:hypothetical protein